MTTPTPPAAATRSWHHRLLLGLDASELPETRAGRARWAAKWAVIVAVLYYTGTEAETLGFPAPHLFAALIIGLVLSLGKITQAQMPAPLYIAAQAVTGVVLGTYIDVSTLKPIGANWLPVIAIAAATLALSVALGVHLSRRSSLDRSTATLGLIAGGSAGIVALSDDYDADPRIVAFIQYLRLALVVLITPLLVRYFLHPAGDYGAVGPKEIEVEASLGAWVFLAIVATVGAVIAVKAKVPAGAFIGPLVLAAALTGTGAFHRVTPPEFPRETAFTLIGLQIGLRFTPDLVRRVRKLFPVLLAYVVVLIVTTGLLAWGLSAMTTISPLNAYLATTPGGINAVVVVAFAAGANTGFVFAVQVLRLLVMVLIAPTIIRRLLSGREKPVPPSRT